jgi:hypothetical protein
MLQHKSLLYLFMVKIVVKPFEGVERKLLGSAFLIHFQSIPLNALCPIVELLAYPVLSPSTYQPFVEGTARRRLVMVPAACL